MKRIIADILLIAVTLALLGHFVTIWIYGDVIIREPNVLILSLETTGLLLILGFAIVCLCDTLKGLDK